MTEITVPRDTDPELIDIGHGHFIRFAGWRPDRELNPQYEGLPDVDKCTVIVRHELLPGDDQEHCRSQGYCESAAVLDGEVTRRIFPESVRWQVESLDALTLSPSLLCHCGDHGHIREGHWVPA